MMIPDYFEIYNNIDDTKKAEMEIKNLYLFQRIILFNSTATFRA